MVAVEEPLVHQVPAQRGVVEREATDDGVDGPLVVVHPRLELERDALQDDPALGLLGRDLGEPSVPEERAQDGLLVLGGRAEREARVARRPDLFGGPPQRLRIEPVRPTIVLEPDDAGGGESGQVLADAGDGDADRFGVVDRTGRYVPPNQVLSLLARHLVKNRGLSGRIVRTVATTHLLDRIARQWELELVETPVGFKYIGSEMQKGDVLIGGEDVIVNPPAGLKDGAKVRQKS